MARSNQVECTFRGYAATYRRAAARLVDAACEAGPARDELVRSLLASWRNHVGFCLEYLLRAGPVVLDEGSRAVPRGGALEALWSEASRVLSALGRRSPAELEAAGRAVVRLSAALSAASAAPGGETALPSPSQLGDLHAAMTFLSELLEREARRLAWLGERRLEALSWIA